MTFRDRYGNNPFSNPICLDRSFTFDAIQLPSEIFLTSDNREIKSLLAQDSNLAFSTHLESKDHKCGVQALHQHKSGTHFFQRLKH